MVELLLNCKTVCCGCVTRYLVLWRGHASADDSCLRLDELAHCAEKVAKCCSPPPRRAPFPPRRSGSACRLARRPRPGSCPAASRGACWVSAGGPA